MRKKPLPTWAAIASFYAGRPVSVSYDPNLKTGATTGLAESGTITLGPTIWKQLNDWRAMWQKGTPAWRRNAAASGSMALSTLLHEAMHNRHWDPASGMAGAGDEPQAIILGSELVPNMLQRYFGARMNSPLTNLYLRTARGRGEYTGARTEAGDRYAQILAAARNLPAWAFPTNHP